MITFDLLWALFKAVEAYPKKNGAKEHLLEKTPTLSAFEDEFNKPSRSTQYQEIFAR